MILQNLTALNGASLNATAMQATALAVETPAISSTIEESSPNGDSFVVSSPALTQGLGSRIRGLLLAASLLTGCAPAMTRPVPETGASCTLPNPCVDGNCFVIQFDRRIARSSESRDGAFRFANVQFSTGSRRGIATFQIYVDGVLVNTQTEEFPCGDRYLMLPRTIPNGNHMVEIRVDLRMEGESARNMRFPSRPLLIEE